LAAFFIPSSESKFWEQAIWLWSAPILNSTQHCSYVEEGWAVGGDKEGFGRYILDLQAPLLPPNKPPV